MENVEQALVTQTNADRLLLVSFTVGQPAPTSDNQAGWCWKQLSESERNWHKLPDVPCGQETWARGVHGDSRHLDRAKAAVEALVGPCVWPDLTLTQLWKLRRIVIDGRRARVHAVAVGIPIGPDTGGRTSEEHGQEPARGRHSCTLVHVRVFMRATPDGKAFRFPKDQSVGNAAKVAAGKFGLQGGSATFRTRQKAALDRSLTLEAARVQDGDTLELIDDL